jgi:hypothetical protein
VDIDEEFDSLCLPKAQESHAWEARAKITWGEPRDEVAAWLIAKGIDDETAKRIVAIAVRERGMAVRVKGVRDLALGILVDVCSAGVGIGAIVLVNLGLFVMPIKALAVIVSFSFLALMYGVHLTYRGLARMLGGSRVRGAVSDVED